MDALFCRRRRRNVFSCILLVLLIWFDSAVNAAAFPTVCPEACGGTCDPATTASPSPERNTAFLLSQSRNIHEFQFNRSAPAYITPGSLPWCPLSAWAQTYRGVRVTTIALASRALLSRSDQWTARSLLRSIETTSTNAYGTTNGSAICALQALGYKYHHSTLATMGLGECFHFDWVASEDSVPPANINGSTTTFPSGAPRLANTVQVGLSALALDGVLQTGASTSGTILEAFMYVLELMQVDDLFAESPQKQLQPPPQRRRAMRPYEHPSTEPVVGRSDPTFHPLPPVRTLSTTISRSMSVTTTNDTTAPPEPNTTTSTAAPTGSSTEAPIVPTTTTAAPNTTTTTTEGPNTTTTTAPTTAVPNTTTTAAPTTARPNTTTTTQAPPETTASTTTAAPTTMTSTAAPTTMTSTAAPTTTAAPSTTTVATTTTTIESTTTGPVETTTTTTTTPISSTGSSTTTSTTTTAPTTTTASPPSTTTAPATPAPTLAPDYHAHMATQLLLHSWMRGFASFEAANPGSLTATQQGYVDTLTNQTNRSIVRWFCSAPTLSSSGSSTAYIPYSVDLQTLAYNETFDAWTQCAGLAAVGTLLDEKCNRFGLSVRILEAVVQAYGVTDALGQLVGIASSSGGAACMELSSVCLMAAHRLQAAYLPSFLSEIGAIVTGLSNNGSILVQQDCTRQAEVPPDAAAYDQSRPSAGCGGPLLSLRETALRSMALRSVNPFEVTASIPTRPPPSTLIPDAPVSETINLVIGAAVGGTVLVVAGAVVFRRARRTPQAEVLLQPPAENLGFY